MLPTVGRIVKYKMNGQDANAVNERRAKKGTAGNMVTAGQVFPAMMVAVWSEEMANLKVFLDGDDCYWATSVHEGEGEREFQWPEIARG